jgi:hypothetical protein
MVAATAPNPFSCPRCGNQSPARAQIQLCARCQQPFVLRGGARTDPTVQPPAVDGRWPRIKTRSVGFVVATANILQPEGITQGTLDPVTGLIPMDQSGILFTDIISIAIWRSLDIARLVLSAVLLIPMLCGLVYLGVRFPLSLPFTVPLDALIVFAFYRLLVIRRNHARIVSTYRTLDVQFDTPFWRRQRFHDELLRRAGISQTSIP